MRFFVFLGNKCNNVCPPGWSSHLIGLGNELCLFTSKSKMEISQVESFCQRLNATVPYPKNYYENLNYRNAFNLISKSPSTAIKSRHGIVELNRNGYWNPFPINRPFNRLINIACEKPFVGKYLLQFFG